MERKDEYKILINLDQANSLLNAVMFSDVEEDDKENLIWQVQDLIEDTKSII